MKCEISHSLLQRKNKTKHDNTKKHKYCSNLILNTYIVKDVKLDEFKDVLSKYCFDHIKKFNSFTVRVYWKVNNEIQFKLSVPHVVFFGTIVHSMTVNKKETGCDFLDRAIKAYFTEQEIERINETEIGFVSDLNDITFKHYTDLTKPMICRKVIRRFFEVKSENINDFEFNWLPDFLRVDNQYNFTYKMNIKTILLGDYVNFVNRTKKKNKDFKIILISFVVFKLFCFYFSF